MLLLAAVVVVVTLTLAAVMLRRAALASSAAATALASVAVPMPAPRTTAPRLAAHNDRAPRRLQRLRQRRRHRARPGTHRSHCPPETQARRRDARRLRPPHRRLTLALSSVRPHVCTKPRPLSVNPFPSAVFSRTPTDRRRAPLRDRRRASRRSCSPEGDMRASRTTTPSGRRVVVRATGRSAARGGTAVALACVLRSSCCPRERAARERAFGPRESIPPTARALAPPTRGVRQVVPCCAPRNAPCSASRNAPCGAPHFCLSRKPISTPLSLMPLRCALLRLCRSSAAMAHPCPGSCAPTSVVVCCSCACPRRYPA